MAFLFFLARVIGADLRDVLPFFPSFVAGKVIVTGKAFTSSFLFLLFRDDKRK